LAAVPDEIVKPLVNVAPPERLIVQVDQLAVAPVGKPATFTVYVVEGEPLGVFRATVSEPLLDWVTVSEVGVTVSCAPVGAGVLVGVLAGPGVLVGVGVPAGC
jgi:hypothetical protein